MPRGQEIRVCSRALLTYFMRRIENRGQDHTMDHPRARPGKHPLKPSPAHVPRIHEKHLLQVPAYF